MRPTTEGLLVMLAVCGGVVLWQGVRLFLDLLAWLYKMISRTRKVAEVPPSAALPRTTRVVEQSNGHARTSWLDSFGVPRW